MRRTFTALAFLLALVVLAPAPGRGQPGSPSREHGRETPRQAMAGFLAAARAADWERAAEYLDLRRLPAPRRREQGPVLARDLKSVLDQALWVEPETLSDAPEGQADDGLAPDLDRVGTIPTARGPVEVLLQRGPEAGLRTWKVSADTVTVIPALAREFTPGVLTRLLPAPLVEIRLLEVALWQWLGILALVLVAWGLSWLVTALLVRTVRPILLRTRLTVDEQLLDALVAPVRLAAALVAFALGILVLALPLPVRRFLTDAEQVAAIVVVAWLLLRALDVLGRMAETGLAAAGRTAAIAVVPVGRKATKVVLLALSALAVLQNLGVNVTGILAGLGIGGLAVALAAQKTVENLFGGLALILDQPVRVGDVCRFGDTLGTVEEVGLRSTRVRTLDRTLVSIPNAEFSALQLENFTRRDKIWFRTTLGLRYETTPDQLRWVLVEVRKLLYAHPRVDPDPARIRFVGFGPHSLDLEIFAYVLTRDFDEFLAIREDLYLRILDVVAASGTGFAFPSQTAYLARDPGLDAARTRAAEAEVQGWRARSELPLPEFPPERIAALRETLRYPPEGAAVGTRPS